MIARVLMVDDDRELCTLLQEFLEREGFQIVFAHDGISGLDLALTGNHDLIILDLMLPGMDGFSVLSNLRKTSVAPVLVLTARGEEEDRIIGLERGADDYLAKPFNPRELIARIRAILRRTKSTEIPSVSRLEVEGVSLDPGTREVRYRGRAIPTTSFEFEILEALMKSAGRVVSRDELAEVIYNRKAGPYDRSIDMHVSHLRRKLPEELIKTVRGAGYQFRRTGGVG